MSDMTGKVALITGAGYKGGIGRAIAHRLAKDGADIVATDLSLTFPYRPIDDFKGEKQEEQWGIDDLVKEVERFGPRGLAIAADLRDSQQIRDMVKASLYKFGAIDRYLDQ
jgi:NAD(P)-dependent dehydrogenase (short-subunit alcohol dehydrogenase family)